MTDIMDRELSDPDLYLNIDVETALECLHDYLQTHRHSYPGGETARKFSIILLRALRTEVERLNGEIDDGKIQKG